MMLSAAPQWLSEAEIHILSTGSVIGAYAEKLSTAGYRLHHIAFAKRLSFFRAVGQLLRRERFDVVHLHTERASPLFALTVRIAVGYSTFLVRTVHHIFKFEGVLRWRKVIERQTMRLLLRVTIVSNSPSGQRNESHRYFVKNPLIPNWYDSNRYVPPSDEQRSVARSGLGFSDHVCVFLSLGGNWSYKNYAMIVQALAKMPESLNVLYVQVGPQGEGNPLDAAASALGVERRIRCVGVVDDPLVYLHASDAYLMPSSEEGFGVAAVEAMAAGLPAVLSNVEALSDFRERVEGILYIEPNPDAIASAMTRMISLTSAERRTLGQKQAADTRDNYGLTVGPPMYAAVYRLGVS